MTLQQSFKQSPWDSAVFGMLAYEIAQPSLEYLQASKVIPGHYTVRIDPLASKQALHEHGFYYCDTLIEPHCTAERFIAFDDADVAVSRDVPWQTLLDICHGAFSHGRFHRDFNLDQSQADQRYDNWLAQLHDAGQVYGLFYQGVLAGFIAVNGGCLVLHAVAKSLRGKGLAKRLWTPVCQTLFAQGCYEITSSVSAANLAVVNLYAALGFSFRNPVDIYHRMTP